MRPASGVDKRFFVPAKRIFGIPAGTIFENFSLNFSGKSRRVPAEISA